MTQENNMTQENADIATKPKRYNDAQKNAILRYQQKNKEKHALYNREYYRAKYSNNPEYSQKKKEYYQKKKLAKLETLKQENSD
jgi:hypothetical protein